MRSMYVGGNGSDACYVVELNDAGQVIIAGGTQSSNFPLVPATAADASWNGETDGFVTLLNPTTFALQGGTFVGTTVYDQVYFAQSDNSGSIYVYGQTEGNMPITAGLYGQPNSGQFISKFNAQLSAMEWNTTVGTGSGAIDISPTAFMVSECGQIYFSGWGGEVNSGLCSGVAYDCYASQSTTIGLPITADAFQTNTDGSDFYLGVLQPNATDLLYGSFLGGPLSAEHVDGGTSRFDKNGSVYHAVCAGCHNNDDFPTTPGAWSSTNESTGCNLAVFRFDLRAIQAEVEIDGPDQVCVGETVSFNNLTTGATNFTWNFGDGTTSTLVEPDHQFADGGQFTIQLIGSDNALCVTADTATVQIVVIPDVNPTIQDSTVICAGTDAQLQATGSANLHWLYSVTLSALDIPNPVASPSATTTYYVVDENECDAETLSVVVEVSTVSLQISNDTTLCVGQTVQFEASGGTTYAWSPATYLDDATLANPVCAPLVGIDYTVTATNAYGCEDDATLSVLVFDAVPGGHTYADVLLCEGESAQLQALAGNAWNWQPPLALSGANTQAPLASPEDTTQYSVTITNPCGVGVDVVTVNVIHPQLEVSGGGSICAGDTIGAHASGAAAYYWKPAAMATPSDAADVVLSPSSTTTFEVTGVDEFNCVSTESVVVFVYPIAEIEAGPDAYFNSPDSVRLYGNALGFPCYWWPSEGLSCDSCEQPMASPLVPTVYHLSIVDDFGCVNDDSVYVQPFYPVFVPNAFSPNGDGINDIFLVQGIDLRGFHLMIYDRWGILVFETHDIAEPWQGQGLTQYYVTSDVYNWVVEYDSLDRTTRLTGHVTIAR
jgi:gliding motility-associated-like protein